LSSIINNFGFLPKYAYAELKNIHKKAPADIKSLLKNYVKVSAEEFYNDKHNLFIFSPYRVGKTWTLHAIANHIIKNFNERSVLYITANSLQRAFTDYTLSNDGETLIQIIAEKRVLFVDDLGLEYHKAESDYVKKKLEGFFRFRCDYSLITYIASQVRMPNLIEMYSKSFHEFLNGEYIDFEIESDINLGDIILEEKLKHNK